MVNLKASYNLWIYAYFIERYGLENLSNIETFSRLLLTVPTFHRAHLYFTKQTHQKNYLVYIPVSSNFIHIITTFVPYLRLFFL